MNFGKGLPTALFTSFLLAASGLASAQPSQGNGPPFYGPGQPHTAQDLPLGKLRTRLESLPPQASGRALQWLQQFEFPQADLDTLEVDDEGGVYYGDTNLPDPTRQGAVASSGPTVPGDAPSATLDDAFLLHSRPGAPNVVFVDFDGDIISGTAWNGSVSQFDAVPYDLDGDPSTFNSTERTRMVDIWHRIAEDYAPYDIDVTTEDPGSFGPYTGHILVTNTNDANGVAINCTSCGGVAYVGVFGRSNYTYYQPALVFFNKLGNGGETYVAEAASHEFGHNLGLSHDGTTTGTTYYSGLGTGLVSWAPIMGVGYYNNVTEFSKGEYPDANNTQDDLAIIDGKLGYAADDHGDTRATASTLAVGGDGSVVASNPELDPHNLLPENKGVIDSSSDVDVFSFAAGAGTIDLTVDPAWDAFYRATSRRGANLDVEAELQDVNGNTLAVSDPVDDTYANVSASVPAGTYYLLVAGVGNALTPYSDYDSMGEYFINGSVPPAAADTTPPTPDPMTWASAPAAVSDTAIGMTATTATDDFSTVEYNFRCTVGGQGCVNSGWQASSSYTAGGLAADTAYTFEVLARDLAHNQTAPSAPGSATTLPPPPPPAAPTNLSASGVSDTAIDLAWTDNASDETGYRVERSPSGQNSFNTIATLGVGAHSYGDTGLAAATTYDYRVAAFNDRGDSGFATASGTTNEPPASVNYVAVSDASVAGSVSGSASDTYDDDGVAQAITERQSGGRKSSRYTYLEHRWSFSISSGATATIYANAWSGGSSDGDTFDFEYSLDGGNSFALAFNVSSTSDANLASFDLPGSPSGSVIVRVVDTDQTAGHNEANTVYVDQLYIQVGNPSTEPPNGNPSGLSANAVSSSRIDLSWNDGSTNESGFIVKRSLDGVSWSQVADLPADSTSYSDSGLAGDTTYYYRVSAYNLNGTSGSTTASATTPPAPALSLSASGYKVKGRQHVTLDWGVSTNVDVYRDGSKVATNVSGPAYDDNIGAKGAGTYTHQVCETGTSTCSNVTTTVF